MTEIFIFKKFLEKYNEDIIRYWKSPYFKQMRWDIFKVFDLIVIWKGMSPSIEFIQLTELSNLSHRRNKIREFFKEIGTTLDNSSIFAYDKRKDEFKIENCGEYGDI